MTASANTLTAGDFRRRLDAYIGERIRARRVVLGWRQQHLADDLHIAVDDVDGAECGRAGLSATQIGAYAQTLDVMVGYFYRDAPDTAAVTPLYAWSRQSAAATRRS